jgi:iron complex outermembrane receptor protein
LPTTFTTTGAINNRQQFDNTSTAVFAEFTYDLSQWLPGLSLTAGGRQTWDEREATILNENINGNCRFRIDHDNNSATAPITILGTDVRCRVDAAAEFDAFTYNLAVNYKPDDDTLLYASLRRGFRSGGFSARATTDEGLRRPNDPEFVRTAELGFKRDWHFGDAFLRTNLAIFQSDYTDIQRQVNDTTQVPAFSVIVNAAEATVRGAELEVLFRPVDRLELSGFWGYTDAQFDSFVDPFTLTDLSGSQFARVPENTWRIAAALDLFSSPEVGDLTFRASYSGRDEFIDTDTLENAAVQTIPAHEQIDLHLQWQHFMQSDIDVTFFVRNAQDNIEYQPLASVWSSLGFAAVVPGEPRTVGVQLRYDVN